MFRGISEGKDINFFPEWKKVLADAERYFINKGRRFDKKYGI